MCQIIENMGRKTSMPINVRLKQLIRQALPAKALVIFQALKYGRKKLPAAKLYVDCFSGAVGIEIGGPSLFFQYVVPLYPVIAKLDGVNFSNQTMWEGSIKKGEHFKYFKNRVGFQFISEASDLSQIQTGSYQFLISSNCLEHVANPLKALEEWIRVVAPGGYLLLVLPNKSSNFDHRRPITLFEHLLDDYKNNTSEHDLTHLNEILVLHDLSRDPAAGEHENFRKRSLDNFNNRGLHHHVFDLPLIDKIFSHFGVSLIQSDTTETDYVALGRVGPAK